MVGFPILSNLEHDILAPLLPLETVLGGARNALALLRRVPGSVLDTIFFIPAPLLPPETENLVQRTEEISDPTLEVVRTDRQLLMAVPSDKICEVIVPA